MTQEQKNIADRERNWRALGFTQDGPGKWKDR